MGLLGEVQSKGAQVPLPLVPMVCCSSSCCSKGEKAGFSAAAISLRMVKATKLMYIDNSGFLFFCVKI